MQSVVGSSAFDFHCRGDGSCRTTRCRGNGRSSLRGPVPRVVVRRSEFAAFIRHATTV